MMMNLFSMFDPSTSMNFSLNWLMLGVFMLFLPKFYFLKSSRFYYIMFLLTKYIMKDLKINLFKSLFKNLIFFFMIFNMILNMNYLSVLPFIFSPTAHLSISMYFSLPFWLNLFFSSWIKKPMTMLSHLVPMGTPMILSPFMVLIESISNLIRPITLCVRLTANMIAGHILLHLLSNLLSFNLSTFFSTFIVMNMLMTLEFSVSLIQSYVFITLLSLYLSEA